MFGSRGVYVFFVISGFVMTISSERLEGKQGAWKTFARNRLIRIIPIYWLAMSIKAAVSLSTSGLVEHGQFAVWNFVSSLFFIPSYNTEGLISPFLGPGWTINFEMFFYAVFCLGLFLSNKAWLVASIVFMIVAAVFFTSIRTGTVLDFYFNDDVLDFVAGVFLAKAVRGGYLLPPAVAAVIFVLCLVYLSTMTFPDLPRCIKDGLPSLLLVMATVSLEPKIRGLVPRAALFLGAASYSLYLFHPMIAPAGPRIVRMVGIANGTASVLVSIALSIGVASIIHVLIEVPMTRFFRPRYSERVERDLGRGTIPL
jgi:peptidoglycan/LPS O-acetylase OafA/YrhL